MDQHGTLQDLCDDAVGVLTFSLDFSCPALSEFQIIFMAKCILVLPPCDFGIIFFLRF